MTYSFGAMILVLIGLLGCSTYFMLFRCWLAQRLRSPHSSPAISCLQCLPAMIGALPLLGLLGTISGLLHTFRIMALPGFSGGNLLSDGIASALLTTQYGLAFAIPAWLLLHHLGSNAAVSQAE